MKCDKNVMLMYAVTDRAWVGRESLYEQVEEALQGGATCIQLREKELDEASFLAEAIELNTLCKRYHVPFIVNDNVEIAIQCGADGIHVGQEDMEAGKVRALVGEKMLLGVSAETVEQAITAEKNGADYLGVGAMFKTGTKEDAEDVSFATLRAICDAVSIPVCAIGGIKMHNMEMFKDSHVDGFAIVSAIFGAENIEEATRNLKQKAEQVLFHD